MSIFATWCVHSRTWCSPSGTCPGLLVHGAAHIGAPIGSQTGPTLRGRHPCLECACIMQGTPMWHTLSATARATSLATLTQARAWVAPCSSSANVLSASNRSSSIWWFCQAVKQNTLPPPLLQLKLYGCLGCWGSCSAGRPK